MGGERYIGSPRETIKRLVPGSHAPTVADRCRIWKIVIDIAIEQFEPVPGKRQSDYVILLRLLGHVGYDDHVQRLAFDPSVQTDHPIEILGARHTSAAPEHRRLRTSKLEQVGRNPHELAHRWIGPAKTLPPYQVTDLGVVAPVFILQE